MKFIRSILQYSNDAIFYRHGSFDLISVIGQDKGCIFCGKSPATDFGTKLHIDHVVPFSKGGKSILENLQTLCEECNLGKSNRNI